VCFWYLICYCYLNLIIKLEKNEFFFIILCVYKQRRNNIFLPPVNCVHNSAVATREFVVGPYNPYCCNRGYTNPRAVSCFCLCVFSSPFSLSTLLQNALHKGQNVKMVIIISYAPYDVKYQKRWNIYYIHTRIIYIYRYIGLPAYFLR